MRSSAFTPFAARTQQFVKEQIGQGGEKVGGPQHLPSTVLIVV